jgi:hypothetical protein
MKIFRVLQSGKQEEKQQLIAKKVGKQVYHNEKLYVFKIY